MRAKLLSVVCAFVMCQGLLTAGAAAIGTPAPDVPVAGIKTLYKNITFEEEENAVGNPPFVGGGMTNYVSNNSNMTVVKTTNASGEATKAARIVGDANKTAIFYSNPWEPRLPGGMADRMVFKASVMSDKADSVTSRGYIQFDMKTSVGAVGTLFRFAPYRTDMLFLNSAIGAGPAIVGGQWYEVEMALDARGENVVVEYVKVNGEEIEKLNHYEWKDVKSSTFKHGCRVEGTIWKAADGDTVYDKLNYTVDNFLLYEPNEDIPVLDMKEVYKYDSFDQYQPINYNASPAAELGINNNLMASEERPYYISGADTSSAELSVTAVNSPDRIGKALKVKGEGGKITLWDRNGADAARNLSDNIAIDISYLADAEGVGGAAELVATDGSGGEQVLAVIGKELAEVSGGISLPSPQQEWHRLVVGLKELEGKTVYSVVSLDGNTLGKCADTPLANIDAAPGEIESIYIRTVSEGGASGTYLFDWLGLYEAEAYPYLADVTGTSDLRSSTVRVRFSEAISEGFLAKEYIRLKKNGELLPDDAYLFENTNGDAKEITISMKNLRAYDSVYTLLVDGSLESASAPYRSMIGDAEVDFKIAPYFDISNAALTVKGADDKDEPVVSIQQAAGKNEKISADIQTISSEKQPYVLTFGLYSSANRLVKVAVTSGSISAEDGSVPIRGVELAIPANAGADWKLVCLAIDGTKTMKLLYDTMVLAGEVS